jgi:hypothetical protein
MILTPDLSYFRNIFRCLRGHRAAPGTVTGRDERHHVSRPKPASTLEWSRQVKMIWPPAAMA